MGEAGLRFILRTAVIVLPRDGKATPAGKIYLPSLAQLLSEHAERPNSSFLTAPFIGMLVA
jgi:hypothetical protein